MRKLRIGHGFDVHRLVTGRRLVLGGVEVPFEKGLEGHSDADVLLHAIMDALLGAAGLPDIGVHFPPDDERYRNADSAELLRKVGEFLTKAGYRTIVNIDATVITQCPRMSPHIEVMRKRIAEVLSIESGRVNIKATTTEKIGFIGREEGMAAEAVCLISDE